MPRILATETALPPYRTSQDEVQSAIASWLASRSHGIEPAKVLSIYARAGVAHRRTVVPLDELFEARSFEERNRIYIEQSIALSLRASRDALAAAAVDPTRVALVVTVSCTGFMIPSVDAHLANLLPLSGAIRRLPITELGCAAGAMALSRAAEYLTARPREVALVVSVELPSLSFQESDLSMAHLVSCALFGDGAAAAVLAGGDAAPHAAPAPLPRILASATRFFHGTLEYMGFHIRKTGFHMLLDAAIPELVSAHLEPTLREFLDAHGRDLDAIRHFVIHPGGRRILDIVESMLGRRPGALEASRRVLREHGNLSSGSVFYVLREIQKSSTVRPGDLGLVVAFGPGFNAEMLLLEWT